MQFLNEVLLEALDVFKNFQTSMSSTRNLNFWFISIGLDFSKSETVVGQILQSEIIKKLLFLKFSTVWNEKPSDGWRKSKKSQWAEGK